MGVTSSNGDEGPPPVPVIAAEEKDDFDDLKSAAGLLCRHLGSARNGGLFAKKASRIRLQVAAEIAGHLDTVYPA